MDDRSIPMTELVERCITQHLDTVAVVTVDHVPSDGEPFTSIALKDTKGRLLDSCDRSGFPTPDVRRLLERYFEDVSGEDNGHYLHAQFSVAKPRPVPRTA